MSQNSDTKPISAHASAILSIVTALGSLWIVYSTAQSGGTWYFSALACFVPMLFAIQGIRMSREPGTRFARFSFVVSIIGIALGAAGALGFLYLLTQ